MYKCTKPYKYLFKGELTVYNTIYMSPVSMSTLYKLFVKLYYVFVRINPIIV